MTYPRVAIVTACRNDDDSDFTHDFPVGTTVTVDEVYHALLEHPGRAAHSYTSNWLGRTTPAQHKVQYLSPSEFRFISE